VSLWYDGYRTAFNLMVVSKKVSLEYKLDATSKVASFIEWYEITHRTTNENGRKRKGNAKKAILDFLESAVSGTQTAESISFVDSVKQFKEDTKLPKELQSAKNNLSLEDYESFKSLYEKMKKEEDKNKTD